MKYLALFALLVVPLGAMQTIEVQPDEKLEDTAKKIIALLPPSEYRSQTHLPALIYALNKMKYMQQNPGVRAARAVQQSPIAAFSMTWNKLAQLKDQDVNRAATVVSPAQPSQLVQLATTLIDQAIDLFSSSNISDVKKAKIKTYVAYGASVVGVGLSIAGWVYGTYHCSGAVTTGS